MVMERGDGREQIGHGGRDKPASPPHREKIGKTRGCNQRRNDGDTGEDQARLAESIVAL